MESNRKPISSVMTPTVLTVGTDSSLKSALDLMRQHKASSIIVAEDQLPLGIVTERDLVRGLRHQADIASLSCIDLMQSPVITISADTPCIDTYHLMSGRGIRHIAVTDQSGRLLGIASEGDILRDLGIEYYMRFKDVASVMSERLCLLPPDTTVAAAVARMDEERHSCVLAVDELGRPTGILTERDVVRLCQENNRPGQLRLSEVMQGPVRTTLTTGLLHEAMRTMEEAGIRRLVVVDADGKVRGLLTHHEIIRGLEGSYVGYLKEMLQRKTKELAARQEGVPDSVVLDGLLHVSGLALVTTDRSGRIGHCSKAALGLLDLPPAPAGISLVGVLERLGWNAGARALQSGNPAHPSLRGEVDGKPDGTARRLRLELFPAVVDSVLAGWALVGHELN